MLIVLCFHQSGRGSTQEIDRRRLPGRPSDSARTLDRAARYYSQRLTSGLPTGSTLRVRCHARAAIWSDERSG